MRYVSLFSGVEAATVAWSRLGWEPLAFAEVDEFPSAVLAHRFPQVPNLGDVCKIDWEEFNEKHGAVDVLIGGSPCQSFSIAGGRAGLEGESRLMYEYIRAVRDLVRASGGGASPRYIVWENVPGCLSSNKGRDFGCLLDSLEECGYFVAWRTLDSQFARVPDRVPGGFRGPVPQRRRRVFLVGSLGGPGAADILFERQSLLGDHPKGREAREALAERPEGGAGMGGCAGFCQGASNTAGSIGYGPVSPTIKAAESGNAQVPAVLTPWDVQSKRVYTPEGTSPSLQSGTGEGMNIQPIVMTTANTNANGSNVSEDGTAYTLDRTNSNAVCIQGSMVGRADANGPQGGGVNDGLSFTLNTTDRHAVAFAQNTRDEVRLVGGDGQVVGALAAQPGMKQTSYVCGFVGEYGGNTGCGAEVGQSPTVIAKHAPSVVCVADDNANAAIETDMCGSLKVGGGCP